MANSSNTLMLLLAILALVMAARITGLEQGEKTPFVPGDPKFKDCWKSIFAVEGCAASIISSFFNWRIELTPECCKAINSLNEHCFDMFSTIPFNSLFPPLLKAFCGGKTSSELAGVVSPAPSV